MRDVEYPDIKFVVPPTHLDGTQIGTAPRMRHLLGCSHFKWPDGTFLGDPQPATGDQMHSLAACKDCIRRSERQ